MHQKSAHNQYTNIQISTVDRGRLLLMLYDGCGKFLKQAKAGLEAKDIAKFARFLSKAQAIIVELSNTLDFEKGGTIARDLERLYEFMLFYLTEANLQKDPEKIQKVINLVDVINGAFRSIIEGGKVDLSKEQPAAPIASKEPTKSEKTAAQALPGSTLRVSF